jgi:hypothetical protein
MESEFRMGTISGLRGQAPQHSLRATTTSSPLGRIIEVSALVAVCATLSSAPLQARAADVPNFNGIWGKYTYSYPKPYMKGREIADGYNNPLLRPWVVDLLKADEKVFASGRLLPTAHSLCYPEGVPYVFGETRMQILQTPAEITMIFGGEQEQWRKISLNGAHPAHVVPSWYGDSVGHFEGDTLVVDTVGIAANPQTGSMGFFGTPHTSELHLVERYRFLGKDESSVMPGPNPKATNPTLISTEIVQGGSRLRLTFTVEDPGAYWKPWTVTLDYLPLKTPIQEYVCMENYEEKSLMPLTPKAKTPDF